MVRFGIGIEVNKDDEIASNLEIIQATWKKDKTIIDEFKRRMYNFQGCERDKKAKILAKQGAKMDYKITR